MMLWLFTKLYFLTLWQQGSFKRFGKITAGSHVALRGNISAPVWVTDLVKYQKMRQVL